MSVDTENCLYHGGTEVPPQEHTPKAAPGGKDALREPGNRRRRRIGALLAPVLATVAVGVHWWMSVPPGLGLGARGDQAAPRRAGAPKPRRRPAFDPRPPGELEATWQRYKDEPIADEPTYGAWARSHRSLVHRAIAIARKGAFEGYPSKPNVKAEAVACHTIRCTFVLTSEFAHEVDLLSAALAKLEHRGASLWRFYGIQAVEPGPNQAPDHTYLRVTVAFATDDTDRSHIRLPEEGIVGGDPDADDDDDDDRADSADDGPADR